MYICRRCAWRVPLATQTTQTYWRYVATRLSSTAAEALQSNDTPPPSTSSNGPKLAPSPAKKVNTQPELALPKEVETRQRPPIGLDAKALRTAKKKSSRQTSKLSSRPLKASRQSSTSSLQYKTGSTKEHAKAARKSSKTPPLPTPPAAKLKKRVKDRSRSKLASERHDDIEGLVAAAQQDRAAAVAVERSSGEADAEAADEGGGADLSEETERAKDGFASRKATKKASKKSSKDVVPQSAKSERTALHIEVKYLQDPVRLADRTKALLNAGDRDQAQELVHLASRRQSATVSWNHIIDYDMHKGHHQKALKTFHDMRKRAQQPDAYTYTILLGGLMKSTKPGKGSLEDAMKIYNSLKSRGSSVRPSIIHVNCMLKLCALAQDADALFEVVTDLDTSGPRSPDSVTYATILQALRTIAQHQAEQLVSKLSEQASIENADADIVTANHEPDAEAQAAAILRTAVQQGKQIWAEIMERWEAQTLDIDEPLVAAMGRLLVASPDKTDHWHVFDLIEQTMRLPRPERILRRQTQTLQHSNESTRVMETKSAAVSQPVSGAPEEEGLETQQPERQDQINISESGTPEDGSIGNVFSKQREFKGSVLYPVACNNILQVIMAACNQLDLSAITRYYWDFLTTRTGVDPDTDNCKEYLHLLSRYGSWRPAKALVEQLHRTHSARQLSTKHRFDGAIYAIAMGACARNREGKGRRDGALDLLRMMLEIGARPRLPTFKEFFGICFNDKPSANPEQAVRTAHLLAAHLKQLVNDRAESKLSKSSRGMMGENESEHTRPATVHSADKVMDDEHFSDLEVTQVAPKETKRCSFRPLSTEQPLEELQTIHQMAKQLLNFHWDKLERRMDDGQKSAFGAHLTEVRGVLGQQQAKKFSDVQLNLKASQPPALTPRRQRRRAFWAEKEAEMVAADLPPPKPRSDWDHSATRSSVDQGYKARGTNDVHVKGRSGTQRRKPRHGCKARHNVDF